MSGWQGRPTNWSITRETAIIICDMWDNHYCQSSAGRVHLIASHLNAMVAKARTLPVEIIHALSGTMDVYADPAK